MNGVYSYRERAWRDSVLTLSRCIFTLFAQGCRGAEEQPPHNRPALPLAADFAKASQL
jgi:hypothetical protein